MYVVLNMGLDHNDHQLLWAAFSKLGVTFPEDIFLKIESDDVVEIYRPDGIQIFRNPQFYKISSHLLPDLFIKSWFDLFMRSNQITESIFKSATEAFTQTTSGYIDLSHIPRHNLTEINSPGSYLMQMKHKFLHALSKNDFKYAIAVCKVEVLEKFSKVGHTDHSTSLTLVEV